MNINDLQFDISEFSPFDSTHLKRINEICQSIYPQFINESENSIEYDLIEYKYTVKKSSMIKSK